MKSDEPSNNPSKPSDRLNHSERQLSSLCEHHSEGIILHDLNGDILDANSVATRLFGCNRDELTTLNLRDIQIKSKRDSDDSVIALEVYNDSKVDVCRTVFVRKDGSRFPVDVKTSYIRFNQQDHYITVVQRVFRDVKANEERTDRKGKTDSTIATDLDQQENFIHLLNRELKSPLSEMLSAMNLLAETEIDDERKSLLSVTMKSGDYLVRTINDVLDFFRLQFEQFDLVKHRFNLVNLIGDIIELTTPLAEERCGGLAAYVDSSIPEFVYGDEARIRELLLKFIHNAISMTTTGKVKIEVNRDNDQKIKFEIIDSGHGIDAHHQKYFSCDDPISDCKISRRFADITFNYIICRKIIKMMAGEIGFKSVVDQGSNFWFSLQLENHTDNGSIATANTQFLENIHLVFIDCESNSRNELERQLASWGATVTSFGDENTAEKYFSSRQYQSTPPHLIVLNVHEANETYAALIREINEFLHQDDNITTSQFVVITPGYFEPQAARHFARVKHTHVKHPLRTGVLANKLARLLRIDEPFQIDNMPIGKDKKSQEEPAYQGRILIADDGKVTQMATSAILSKQGFSVECASNGWEAIHALEKSHYDVILMDVQMPEMDGIEATKRIRAMEKFEKHTPILAITANMESDVWKECVYAGMDDYMTKPIDTQVMTATIQYWLGTVDVADPFNLMPKSFGRRATDNITNDKIPYRKHLSKANARQQDRNIAPSDSIAPPQEIPDHPIITKIKQGDIINQPILDQMIADTDPVLTHEMIDLYIEETSSRVLRLLSASNSQDLKTLSAEAHALCSSSETFGANWLYQLAVSLENHARENDLTTCVELARNIELMFSTSKLALKEFQQSNSPKGAMR